jgi:hypothetical protein
MAMTIGMVGQGMFRVRCLGVDIDRSVGKPAAEFKRVLSAFGTELKSRRVPRFLVFVFLLVLDLMIQTETKTRWKSRTTTHP